MKGTGTGVGSKAPDFSLKDEGGTVFQLSETLKNGPVLIAFYPGDFTMVCTRQLCNYRDNWSQFKDLGIQVVGISANDTDSHFKFVRAYDFPFPLLSDPGKKVARLYGCTSMFMLGAVSRAVAMVNQQGILLYRYVEPTAITYQSTDELMGVLKALRANKLM